MSATLPVQPLRYGAELIDARRTRFRLWAPTAPDVQVQLDDGRVLAMQAQADGWFERVVDCGAGTGYRYRVGEGLAVPDPASRAQRDDVHGDSLVVDPQAYRWRHADWRGRPWHEVVLYEVHVGCYGGYEGLRRQLPQLAALGITAVELMPLADFPGRRNWGYDGVLPYAPDRAYGTPEQLKQLIDDAHGLGLMMFLDVVYNHFGPDGNYLHAYAAPFFRDDRPTLWGPAIDFRQPQVREFFTANALYWLQEYRFDGLRFDAVHAIHDPSWLDETAAAIRAAVVPERAVHLVLENDANIAQHLRRQASSGFDAQWNDDLHHALHVLLTGETEGYYAAYADAPARHLARCLAEGFAYQGEYSKAHEGPRGTPSADLPPHAFVAFLQNHDQIGNRAFGERLTTLAHPQALQAAVALQLLAPQIPLLFMGEDWASRKPFLFFTDHGAELAAAVREGRRREFQRFAAFADAANIDRIPDANQERSYVDSCPDLAAAGQAEGAACRRRYAELLRLRREHLWPGLAQARSLGAEVLAPKAVRAAWQLGNGARLTLAINLDDRPIRCALPVAATLLHATVADYDPAGGQLPPYCTAAFLEARSGA